MSTSPRNKTLHITSEDELLINETITLTKYLATIQKQLVKEVKRK